MDMLLAGVDRRRTARSTADGGPACGRRAIMTTDTVPKTAQLSGRRLHRRRDGQGRRHARARPGDDARRADHRRRRRLRRPGPGTAGRDAGVSFDRLDSDGAMSTNDTVLLLASGASGYRAGARAADGGGHQGVQGPRRTTAGRRRGRHQGDRRSRSLHAATEDDAVEVGRSVARNNLVKTAFFGQDPNWGRILAAVGTTGRRASTPTDRRRHQRRLDLPGRRRPARTGTLVDLTAAGRARRSSTCTPAPRPRPS